MKQNSHSMGLAVLASLVLLAGCVMAPAEEAIEPPAEEVRLMPPDFTDEPGRDSMPKIIDQALTALQRHDGPNTQLQAIGNVLRALHMSGIVIMPTAGVPETEAMFRADLGQRQRVVQTFQGRLESGDPSDEVGRALLDAKAFLEAEVDMLQTLAAWTITVNPGTPEAEVLAEHNIRAPFIPYAPLRSPKKDIRTGVIENGECFIVLKEMHGIKARLIAEIIPVWIEPWYARRHIVGHRIVWRLEFVPAEFVKKLTTCNERGKLVHDVYQEEVLEPKLLNFWRFYGKGHGKGYGKGH